MRKRITAFLAIALTFSMAACANANAPTINNTPASSTAPGSVPASSSAPVSEPSGSAPEASSAGSSSIASSEPSSEESSTTQATNKILVAYFSRMGNMSFDPNVDAVASATVQVSGTDYTGNNQIIADMVAEKTGGDVFFIEQVEKYPAAYRATTDQVKAEQNSGARPALATQVENMEQYSTVVLVYPNWWGSLPPAVCTFLEAYDFSGKTILPLATHEGSGLGSGPSEIESLCPDATVFEGLSIRGSAVGDAKTAVDTWVDASGILQ